MRISEIKEKKTGIIRGTLNYTIEVARNKKNYLKCKIGTGVNEIINVNVFEGNVDKNGIDLYAKINELPKTDCICDFEIRYDGKNGDYENFTILDMVILKVGKNIDIVNVDTIKLKFREILNVIKDQEPNLAELIEGVYSDKRISKKAFISPYSENSGYNYICGNATQSLRLCYLCESIATMYNNWDLSKDGHNIRISLPLLYTASFLSNIGKNIALEFEDKEIIRTYEGQLHNDMVITMEIVSKHLDESKLEEGQKSLLKHIIASSKDTNNFGALELPRTREAVIFALAEKMNSIMGTFETMDREAIGDFHQIYQKTYCLTSYQDI